MYKALLSINCISKLEKEIIIFAFLVDNAIFIFCNP